MEKIYVANPGSNDTVFTYVHLSNLYRSIAEEDFYYGLCSDFSTVQDSRVALVFQHVGMWQKAQQVSVQIVPLLIFLGFDPRPKGCSTWGLAGCASSWTRNVALSLGRLQSSVEPMGTLMRVCKSQQKTWFDCPNLLEDWPMGMWCNCTQLTIQGLMEETFKTNSLLNAESPQIKILQSFVLLRENKTQEVDSLCKHAMSYLVTQWTIYPSLPSIVHTQMLHSFQRIMELYETSNILKLLATPKTPTRTNGESTSLFFSSL